MSVGIASLLAIGAAIASGSMTLPDPPSGVLDPPPGAQDYIEAFPPQEWVFGKLLWKGEEPCAKDFCEAAYNAAPLFLLVQKQAACCGGTGYSLTVIGRVAGCSGVTYYLVRSKDIDHLTDGERLALLSRHVADIASAISSFCGKSINGPVPTEALSRLWK